MFPLSLHVFELDEDRLDFGLSRGQSGREPNALKTCRSVVRLVRRSVGRSVRRSVGLSVYLPAAKLTDFSNVNMCKNSFAFSSRLHISFLG